MAMFAKKHADRLRPVAETGSSSACQIKAGHYIWHVDHLAAENFPHDRLGIRQVSKSQKRCRMRMVDELVWKERMKQRLHRGVRRRRIKQISALNVDHFLIRQPVKALEFKQPVKTDSRQSRCLDYSQIPPRSFDAKNINPVTEKIGGHRFT